MSQTASPLELLGPRRPEYETILTDEALSFVGMLCRRFEPRRRELLARRAAVQVRLDGGWVPDFLVETADVRRGEWRGPSIPSDLMDRRVEITGPVERKMIINALNSGARVFMADFEDANSPTWDNVEHLTSFTSSNYRCPIFCTLSARNLYRFLF